MAFIAMVAGFAMFGVVIYLVLFKTPFLFAEQEHNPMGWYFQRKKSALWRRLGMIELFFVLLGIGFIAGGLVATIVTAGAGGA